MNVNYPGHVGFVNAGFQATVLTSLFQNLLYNSTEEACEAIIVAFLPYHVELGVGEDFLRTLLYDLAAGEIGAVANFAGHLLRSNNAFWSLWRVTYGV
jgi:hypothetical protein